MKMRVLLLVTLFVLAFSGLVSAHVRGGSITGLRNTNDGQKIVIFTQEGYSVATVLEFVADKPMSPSNIIEAVNGYLTKVGKVRILDEYTHSADNYIEIHATHLSEESANRWLSRGGNFEDLTGGSITKIRNTNDGQKMVIYTQDGYSVATVLEFVIDKPMSARNIIEAVNGYLTKVGKVRILDEHTHSADNYIEIHAAHLSEEEANRWLSRGGKF